MLKKQDEIFKSLLFFIDMLLIYIAWLVACFLHFYPGQPSRIDPIESCLIFLLPITLIWSLSFRIFHLYRARRMSFRFSEEWEIVKACSLATVMLISVSVFLSRFESARLVFVLFWLLGIVLVTLNRWTFREALRFFRRKGHHVRYSLVIGAGPLAQKLVEKLQRHQELGVRVCGYLTRRPEKIGKQFFGVTVLGGYDDLPKILTSQRIDQVFLALPREEYINTDKILLFLQDYTVDVRIVPDLYRFMSIQGQAELFEGLPLVTLQASPLYGWNRVSKRAMDIFFSLMILLVLSPLLFLIAFFIKITSRGPVFYHQKRMGYDGCLFEILKFRSMCVDAEKETGVVWTQENDARRTPIGSLLRRTSLDELSQFFNVLKGEMSIVGPRPERPELVERFRTKIPKYMLRHKIKAGITGWAQVNGWRGNTSLEKRIEHDLEYLSKWSLAFDLQIMCLTIWKGFFNKNAY